MDAGEEADMKQYIRAAAMALSLCLLVGCTHFTQEGETLSASTASIVTAATSPYTEVTPKNDYASLPSDACRSLYDAIDKIAGGISDQQREKGYPLKAAFVHAELSESEIGRTLMAYFNDHPESFWISNVYTYTVTGENVRVQLYSRLSASQRDADQQALNAAVREILAEVPANLSELDREAAVFEALADRCVYDNAAVQSNDGQSWISHTAYGALVQKKATCDGYARAMQLLCGKVGLQCRLVNGQGKGEAHLWNLIRIDGAWYHFDATWMDNDNMRVYHYFNLTDAQIQQDHTISPVDGPLEDCNLPMDAANSTAANYYVAHAQQIDALDAKTRQSVAQALVEAASAGREALALHVGQSLDFQDTVQKLLQGAPYFFQTCVARANTALPSGKKLDYATMRFSTAESQKGISVQLAYKN